MLASMLNPSIRVYEKSGRVKKASGPVLRATGVFSIGEICKISRAGGGYLLSEVIGFDGEETLLTPYGVLDGISSFSKIERFSSRFEVPVGENVIGRVLDSLGSAMDGLPEPQVSEKYPGSAAAPDPMHRPVIDSPFPTGIRAIDGALTMGLGQRMGIFAAAGGGKSTLLSMLVKFTQCDRCVCALIGERGREVREFVEHQLGEEGMAKSVVIVATSDRPAIEQVKAAYTATTIAEYFRDKGENVLLLMDSLTRFARAQRQIGLSAGEPPTRRGFPPSVFEQLPILVERAGRSAEGTITAFYTVLVEGDDMGEPVADEVKSLLDGHIVLSRKLAQSGHYPAIDILSSASRVLNTVTSKSHQSSILMLRELISKYQEIELLLRVGEYSPGVDRVVDLAVEKQQAIQQFLRQKTDEVDNFENIVARIETEFLNE